MKCETARHWIYMYPDAAAMPKALRRHLRQCAACRKKRRRLVRLERQLASAPAPPGHAGLHTFLTRLAELPPQAPGRAAPPPARRPLLYLAASILVLIGLSATMLDWSDPPAPLPENRTARTPHARPEDQILVRFVQRDLVLAGTTAPVKQFQVFSDMADDLQREAVRLADDQAPDDLPMLANLYERVLQRGLLGRAGRLPAPERKDLLQSLVRSLRMHDDELAQKLRDSSADWVTLLQPMQKVVRQTSATLADDAAPAPAEQRGPAILAGGSDYRRMLLAALVMNGLRLAEDGDPLQRADCCSDLADRMLQAIAAASVKGDQHNVSVLGKHLGEFVERGVSANLARVPNDDPRVLELKKVVQRSNEILTGLDRTLEQMSSRNAPAEFGPKELDQLKGLEKMLKDVEKSLKKVQKSFKGDGKGKDKKEKEEREKNKKKRKGKAAAEPPTPRDLAAALPEWAAPISRIVAGCKTRQHDATHFSRPALARRVLANPQTRVDSDFAFRL